MGELMGLAKSYDWLKHTSVGCHERQERENDKAKSLGRSESLDFIGFAGAGRGFTDICFRLAMVRDWRSGSQYGSRQRASISFLLALRLAAEV